METSFYNSLIENGLDVFFFTTSSLKSKFKSFII